MIRLATLAVIAGLAAGPAPAQSKVQIPAQMPVQTPARCAILGQMAVSSWLQMMGALGNRDAESLDPVVARLADLTDLYDGLDCDEDALEAAMDCLLDRSGSDAPQDLARACMADAGLSSGG